MKIVAALAVAIMLASPNAWADYLQREEALRKALIQNAKCDADADKLRVGMTKRETEDALTCYFKDGEMRVKVPINTIETREGILEQWVIRRWGGVDQTVLAYAYFEGDRLVTIQRSR